MSRPVGRFSGGPDDGAIISLTEQEIADGYIDIRHRRKKTRYTVIQLDPPEPVDDVIATHKLVPEAS